jgi:hypothetical protein
MPNDLSVVIVKAKSIYRTLYKKRRLSGINHDHNWTLLFRRLIFIPVLCLGECREKAPAMIQKIQNDTNVCNSIWVKHAPYMWGTKTNAYTILVQKPHRQYVRE